MEESEADMTMELPVLEMELGNQDHDQTVAIRQEEFVDLEMKKEQIEEELKDKKVGVILQWV